MIKQISRQAAVLIGLGICALTFLGFVLISGLTSNLTQTINTQWSFSLNEGKNEVFVRLPTSAYFVMVTDEQLFRSGVGRDANTRARVSYIISDLEGRVIFGPSSDTRSMFIIGSDLQYKPLRIQIEKESDEGHPAFFSVGGTK